MNPREWLDRLAPDLVATLLRFPLASLLIACTTVAVLIAISNPGDLPEDIWVRIVGGLATGSVFAVAGAIFAESRPEARWTRVVLAYAVPVLAVGAFQVSDTNWVVPWAFPAISILWLSVSGFTSIGIGAGRDVQQERFWWFNHQAAATAFIAIVSFGLIALGLMAIERSLSVLFGLDASDVFYRWVLPIIGFLFTPLYWLATIPRLSNFDGRSLREPDFIARAIGFLGQFVLTPLLLAYALILLAYTVQIVLTQTLPQGVLGWMVLGFVTTGAATWLLVYPPFMRERFLVRILRGWWFWLTIIPLALYALAVGVRIDAYGLTPERMVLVAGGLWAALLTVVFLSGRGDIRLIPGLAALILLVFSVGPWNLESLPRWTQGVALDALLTSGGVTGPDSKPAWSTTEGERAVGAMSVLLGTDNGRADIKRIFADHGVSYEPGRDLDLLGLGPDENPPDTYSLGRNFTQPLEVSATPYFVGRLSTSAAGTEELGGLAFALNTGALTVTARSGASVKVDLKSWVGRDAGADLNNAVIDFELDGTRYRYLIDLATVAPQANGEREVTYLDGTLFADKALAAKPTP